MQNRYRLIVTLGGPWRRYQHVAPQGWQVLGTVQRGYEIGALARNEHTGMFVMLRAGAVSQLDQRKVEAAVQVARAQSRFDLTSEYP